MVTGAGGFVGRYVCEHLAESKHRIIGVDLSAAGGAAERCDEFFEIDMASSSGIAEVVRETRPEYVIHLAGRFRAEDPQELYRTNVLSAAGLLEAVRRFTPDAVVVLAGSAAEWGRVGSEHMPIVETTPCRPVTPYGLSKLMATQTALYFHRVHGVCVMVVRPFQLIGAGVPSTLAPGAFAQQLHEAVRDGSHVVRVGNLETWRDFLDVRDAARAIWMLCEKPAGGEVFNVCSGLPTRMADLLDRMIEEIGEPLSIEVDPARFRGGAEVVRMYGSHEKLRLHCGWQPTIDLASSVRDLIAAAAN
jgi:GDP-4-dehydro-6-deoxy-D-mannose reductase